MILEILGAGVTWLIVAALLGLWIGSVIERGQYDLLADERETEMALYPESDRDVHGELL